MTFYYVYINPYIEYFVHAVINVAEHTTKTEQTTWRIIF